MNAKDTRIQRLSAKQLLARVTERVRVAVRKRLGDRIELLRLRDRVADLEDALCTRLANARHEAVMLGYCAGHNDTVEGTYGDPSEAAADICHEMDETKGWENDPV